MGYCGTLTTKGTAMSDFKYDKTLDEIIWENIVDLGDPYSKSPYKWKFVVRVMRYNNGKPKVDIKRLSYGRGSEGTYVKTGRFTKDELLDLLPVLNEAIEKMTE